MDLSLTTLILIQSSVSLALLLALQTLFGWRAKKRDRQAMAQLVDRVQQRKEERSAFLDAYLQTGLNWTEERAETVELLLKAERGFLKTLVAVYLSRDPSQLAELDTRLYELLEQYQFLSPVSHQDEETSVEPPTSSGVSQVELQQLQKDKKRLTLELHQALRVLNDLFVEHSAMFGDQVRPEQDLSVREIQQQLEAMGHRSKPADSTSAHQQILSTLSEPVAQPDWSGQDPFAGYDETGQQQELESDREQASAPDLELQAAVESDDERLAREWAQQLEEPAAEPPLVADGLDLSESDDERLAREWAQQLEEPAAEPPLIADGLDLTESDDERLAREWAQQLEEPAAEPPLVADGLDLTESDDERLAREWAQQLEEPAAEPPLVADGLDLTESDDERLAREWAQQLEEPAAEPPLDLKESDDERLAREWAQQLEAPVATATKTESEDEKLAREWAQQLGADSSDEAEIFSDDQLSSLFAELDDQPVPTAASSKTKKNSNSA